MSAQATYNAANMTSSLSATNFWSRELYIKSARYDWFWIILSPLWAIAFGYVMSKGLFQKTATFFDTTETAAFFLYMALTQAHLFITVFRTHANNEVFETYFWRFTLVPLCVVFAAISSNWIFAFLFVLMTLWDVYHSALQVFGIGRIYDRKAGNDPNIGRNHDYLICILMYIGPILSGTLLAEHLGAFGEFHNVDDLVVLGATLAPQIFTTLPATVVAEQPTLRLVLFGTTAIIVLVYCYELWRLYRKGYRMPMTKIVFFAGTAFTCIFAWGYNSFGMGFLIANIFHAVQYFSLVWVMEQDSIERVFSKVRPLRFALFLAVPLTLGLLSISIDSVVVRTLLITCALMHFWWDGFIWSVRSDTGLKTQRSTP